MCEVDVKDTSAGECWIILRQPVFCNLNYSYMYFFVMTTRGSSIIRLLNDIHNT
jgi:hypothetical protein